MAFEAQKPYCTVVFFLGFTAVFRAENEGTSTKVFLSPVKAYR